MLVLAAIAGSLGALWWSRYHQGRPRRRLDRPASALALGVAAILALGSLTEASRSLLGFGLPARCGEKPPPGEAQVAEEDVLLEEHRRQTDGLALRPRLEFREVEELTQLTGPGRTMRWGVYGTDLGFPVEHEGDLGLIFGDTFGSPSRSGWRSNVMAWTRHDPVVGLVIDDFVTRSSAGAVELLGSMHQRGLEQTVIPTNAVSVEGRIVVHYMSIKCWGAPGEWVINHAGLAVSDDDGRTFERLTGTRWGADSNFGQVAFVRAGAWLYAFGIPAGRLGDARLARMRPTEVTDLGAWRYWDGEDWVADETAAMPLVPPPVGELSVAFDPDSRLWLMLYLDDHRRAIVLRTAERLTGPWHDEQLAVSEVDHPQLYAPYVLPGTVGDGQLLFTMSRFDTYNVHLMQARYGLVGPLAPPPELPDDQRPPPP